MTVKEYLQQTDAINKHIHSLEVDLEEMRELSISVSSMRYDQERVQGGEETKNAPFVRNLEKIFEVEQKIERTKEELLYLKLEINEKIDLLESVDERALLRARYVNGKSWSEIAKQLGYCTRTIHRIHSNALQHFQLK